MAREISVEAPLDGGILTPVVEFMAPATRTAARAGRAGISTTREGGDTVMNGRRDRAADSTNPPWRMTRADFWSVTVSAFVLLVALTGPAMLDADRLAQAARAALEGHIGIASAPAAEPAATHPGVSIQP